MSGSVSESIKGLSKTTERRDPVKKADIIKELAQLSLRIKNLEKEKVSQLYNRRSNFREMFVVLEESDQKFSDVRKTELLKLQQQVNKVKNMVYKFKRELDDIKPTPEFVERLKVIMEEIEENIGQFKEQQRFKYDELLREEKTLNQEILALEKRFDSWNQPTSETGAPGSARLPQAPLKSARDVNKCLPPEVAAFDKFLQQTGGIRGGWDEYDHGTFLKVRSKHKGKGTYLREAIPALPTKNNDQIHDHERWYQDYLRMVDVKKEAIQRWKHEKEIQKDDKLVELEKIDELEAKSARKREEDKLLTIEAEKKGQYARLGQWKEEKYKQSQLVESLKIRAEKKKASEESARKQKQLELRVQVDEFREKREREQELEMAQQVAAQVAQEEERRRELAGRAGHIKDRNQQLLDGKKAKMDAKLRPEMEKQQRLERFREQSRVEVAADPSRLLKPTEGWLERQRQSEDRGQGQGRTYQMPHRATPTWRQNMH